MNIVNAAAAPADPGAGKGGPRPAGGAQASRSQPPTGPAQKVIPGALLVPIDRVERDPAQPRRDWTHGAGQQRLEELTQSVREFGLLQPLLVRQEGERYVVIAGGRRLVAARRAGMTEIPVVVRHADSATVRILQLLENLQRQELSPTDEARAYQELMDLQGLTPPKIALRVRRHEQHVRDRLRLLRDQALSDGVERRQISATVAREITKLPDEIAEKLRQRVQDGARLHHKDIEEARAHMARDGIVHPRRAPRTDRQSEPVPGGDGAEPTAEEAAMARPASDRTDVPGAAPEEMGSPHWLDVQQQRFVRSDKEAFHKIQQDYQRLRSSGLRGDTPPPSPGAAPSTASGPGEPAPERPEPVLSRTEAPAGAHSTPHSTLAELLSDLDLTRLQQVLLYGIERGMSCAGLWQHIRELRRPDSPE